jgi:hypothetical protein
MFPFKRGMLAVGVLVLLAAVATALPGYPVTDIEALSKYVTTETIGTGGDIIGHSSDYQPQEYKPACLQAVSQCGSEEGFLFGSSASPM